MVRQGGLARLNLRNLLIPRRAVANRLKTKCDNLLDKNREEQR